jgi:type VI secretion system secreted protein VgrG
MQLENALLSFLLQQRDLITEHRPLRLRLSHPTQMLEDVLLPQRVYGTESICGGIEYRILCVALDAYLPLKELIALPVAIDFVTDRGDLRSVCGIVTEAAAGDSDGGLASYQLVLRDALAILEKRTNTRVFRNKNEVEIVKLILDEWRQSNSILGTCFDYETDELFEQREYPQREFTMQYNESDAAFIRRLLKRRGIAWYFRADGEASPAHKLVMFNNAESIQPNAAGVVRYHRDNATEERDSITAWCAVRTLQPGSVTRHSWDYMNPQGRDFMTTTATSGVDQGSSGNEMSASLDDYLVQAPHIGDDHEDLCQLGQLAMSRHDYESKCFHGEGSVRDLCAGEYFTLTGHPEIDLHAEGDRDFVVTSLQVAAVNNLPKTLTERVERLFSCNRWPSGLSHATDHVIQGAVQTKIRFAAVRRGIEIVPAFDPRKDVPNVPLQNAIVVGPEGEDVNCDELGRVKIRFTGMRAQDHVHAQGAGASDTDSDSAWVRVATNWAGSGSSAKGQCGFIGLPRVGSEVLIAFVNADPDRPLIIGQLYNGQGRPPLLNINDQLPLTRHLSGFRSGEFKGDRANQLRFDDTSGQINAQLSSEHGSGELNLGYLIQSNTGAPRGEGAELRTDQRMALRALEGLLISTWKNLDQSDHHMASHQFQQLMLAAQAMIGTLAANAESSQAFPATVNSAGELADAISKWSTLNGSNEQRTAAPIGISSPDGVGVATPGAITGFAGRSIDFATEENFQVSAAGQFVVDVAKGLSIFSEENDFRAIAHAGKIFLQSQGDDTEVHSAKNIRMTAMGGQLSCAAKEIVLTAADGSFIKIGDGITLGSGETIAYHGSKHVFAGRKTMKAKFRPASEQQSKSQRVLTVELVDPDGGYPENEQVQLHFARTGESRTAATTSGVVRFNNLPTGQFSLVQSQRVS